MPDYRVTWEIDITADNPRDAAAAALAIMQRKDSQATVFAVTSEDGETEQIDLMEAPEGFALVHDNNQAFSWHTTREDAEQRQKWEHEIMGRLLRVVNAEDASWPEWRGELQ